MNENRNTNPQARIRRGNSTLSLFQRLSPAQSREARAIAYEAALAVIG